MIENLLALSIATAVLVAIPGPNVALIVANSLRFGLLAAIMQARQNTAGFGPMLPRSSADCSQVRTPR